MVGDALRRLGCRSSVRRRSFIPILPGGEDESWQRFFEEGLPRFFTGDFAGDYMNAQLERFKKCLPEGRRGNAGEADKIREKHRIEFTCKMT